MQDEVKQDPLQPDAQETAQADAAQDALEQASEAAETEAEMKTKTKHGKGSAADAAALRQKAENLEKELASTKDTLLRTAAEYENHRRRSAKEHDAAFGNGLAHAVERLLPVLDTLSLAAGAETADENYKKGVLMTMDKCREVFEKLDVSEIEAEGLPFDPELHAAVLQQPAPEGVESGTVLQVLQKGYRHKEKVLRHATVIVAE